MPTVGGINKNERMDNLLVKRQESRIKRSVHDVETGQARYDSLVARGILH